MENKKKKLAHYFSNQADVYEQVYDDRAGWLKSYWWRPLRQYQQFALASMPMLKGKRVLEIGCGTGHLAVAMAQAGAQVYAIDLSREMVELANRKAKAAGVSQNLQLEVADFDRWDPNVREKFDYVVAITVFDYAGSPELWLKKMADLGLNIILTLPGNPLLLRLVRKVNLLIQVSHALSSFSQVQAGELVKKSGLKVLEQQLINSTLCLCLEQGSSK